MKELEEKYVSIAQAAELLGFKASILDKLIRSNPSYSLSGRHGKGGELRIRARDLPMIEASCKLAGLCVPKPAVKELSQRGTETLRKHPNVEILLSYSEKSVEVFVAPDAAKIKRLIENGAAAVFVHETPRRQELYKRLDTMDAPRRRGRPRLDPTYIDEKLSASSELGEDVEDVAAELRRLNGA